MNLEYENEEPFLTREQQEIEIDAAFDYEYNIWKMTNNVNNEVTSIDSDYEYGDEWDWDKSDPRQYCIHGTFIGSWWGPDILCYKCEIGEPSKSDFDEDYEP